jgi:hypothetical protein
MILAQDNHCWLVPVSYFYNQTRPI